MGNCQHYKMLLNELTLELYHRKHGVTPEPDVPYMFHYNYNRFNWIRMLTFSAVRISMLTFSTS